MQKNAAPTAATAFTMLPHDDLLRVLRETAANPWPTIDDREAWERIAATPHGREVRDIVLIAAEKHAGTPGVRTPTLTEFLAYARTGDRRTWEAAAAPLSERLDAFTLAACFTGQEQWVDRAADALWALCEMASWVTPAHEGKRVPEPENPTVDLWAAMRAQEVAETLQLLAPALDRIDSRIRRHVLSELDRRVFDPFLNRGDWWWLWKQPGRERLNNWTAVCSGGVLCAALAALNDEKDAVRQARIVHRAAWSLGFFKDTFDDAGSLDEGAGYWSYGVSYYVMAAERLAARTGGAMDLLADPFWREVAQFPLRVRLYGNTFTNFSDCARVVRPIPGWLAWMGRRLDVPGLVEWADQLAQEERERYRKWRAGEAATYGERHRYLPFALRTLLWLEGEAPFPSPSPTRGGRETPEEASLSELPSPHPMGGGAGGGGPLFAYLPDVQWLIARSDGSDDALILAVKGGHNAENHNHNDGGSFIVHYRQEALIAELGAPTYTRQFFSSTRYENIAARSLGHSVPFVNGQEQRAGREYAAQVLAQEGASLSLELSGLYPPEAKLVSLRRDIALETDGDGSAVRLRDHAIFTEEGGTLALPLMTLDCEAEVVSEGHAVIRGKAGMLQVIWDPAQAFCRAEEVETQDLRFLDAEGKTRIRRLWFGVTVSGREGMLEIVLMPSLPQVGIDRVMFRNPDRRE